MPFEKNRENNLAEARVHQGGLNTQPFALVKSSEQPFVQADKDKGAHDGAGDGADAADNDDQQDFISHIGCKRV